jgi:hypothetical protein
MKSIWLFTFIFGFSLVADGQENSSNQPRFKPFAGITYNLHRPGGSSLDPDIEIYRLSHFPGLEAGFVILPKKENGWQLSYRNTFLGELAIYGLIDLAGDPDRSFLGGITNQTVGNGFLGRLDLGKKVINTPGKALLAGFSLSDKVILGTDIHLYNTPLQEQYTKEGFHLTPGVFAEYRQVLRNMASFTLNFGLSKSIMNLHQFDQESAIGHYVFPVFSEIDLVYQMPGGLYFRMGTLVAISFEGVQSDARISGGIGYRFR